MKSRRQVMTRLLTRPFRVLEGAAQLLTFHKRHPPVGARPGTLVVPPDAPKPAIRLIRYSQTDVEEREILDLQELTSCVAGPRVSWVDLQGLGDENILRAIADIFGMHPLALEDVVNIPQRPKSESYEHQHLFITRMVRLLNSRRIDTEQISIVLGPHYVLTLQEKTGDLFDPVRKRIRAGTGPMRRSGPDYLAYALIDTVIDGYYPVVELIGDQLHDLEETILDRPARSGLNRIHQMRRELLGLRRSVWPQREAVNALIREESPLVSATVRQYLRDCHDHAVQIADVIETYRELAASLMDVHLSSTGQRTNEVMKVLTVMASIFIPLTLIAGIYGMNFKFQPELSYRWAYPLVLGLMLLVGGGMLIFFRAKGWIGREPEDDPAPGDED